jgi:CubicO group peptidase (beta-lactamase class C family)
MDRFLARNHRNPPTEPVLRAGDQFMRLISTILAGALALVLSSPSGAQEATGLVPPTPAVPPAPAVATAEPAVIVPPGTHALTQGDVEAWLDGFMPYAIGRGNIPGAVVVVVKDGRILAQKGYGYADVAKRKPVDPATTLFRPGSVSKLVTWTAVMQLVEQGKLDLDADISKYLDFAIPGRDGKAITMRHIMTHTTGMEEIVRGLITSNTKDALALDTYLKRWVPTRIFAPGTTPAYSNYATTLAGYIVQRISGQTFDDYVDQHIFAPLQMKHSSFRQPLPASLQPLMSKGYKAGTDKPQGYEIVNPSPAGNLAASGADMGRVMIAHLQNGSYGSGRILGEATAREMHGTAMTFLPPLNRMLLGFYETNVNGHRSISHAGDTQWFHSDLSLFVDDGIGLYISMNSSGADAAAHKVRAALFHGFADRYLPGPALEGKVDAATAKLHAQQMAGLYENSRRSDDSFISIANLAGQTKVVVSEEGSISVPAVTGVDGQPVKWIEIAPYVWRDAFGSDRLAAKVVDGRVLRWSFEPVSPFMVFEPVPWWKSSGWLLLAVGAGVLALLLTVLAWPVSALVRRHYGVRYPLTGTDARAHRLVRISSLVVLATFVGVLAVLTMMFSELDRLSPGNDWIVIASRVLTLVVIPIGTAISLWNAWVVLGSKRRWTAKLWAIVLALSCLAILWACAAFHLIGFSANY